MKPDRKEHHVRCRGDDAAMMSRTTEAPLAVVAGQRMRPCLGFAGVQVERPRFGINFVADDRRTIHVVGVFRPQLFSIAGIENQQFCDLSNSPDEKLFPVVTVRVCTTQNDMPVGIHQVSGCHRRR